MDVTAPINHAPMVEATVRWRREVIPVVQMTGIQYSTGAYNYFTGHKRWSLVPIEVARPEYVSGLRDPGDTQLCTARRLRGSPFDSCRDGIIADRIKKNQAHFESGGWNDSSLTWVNDPDCLLLILGTYGTVWYQYWPNWTLNIEYWNMTQRCVVPANGRGCINVCALWGIFGGLFWPPYWSRASRKGTRHDTHVLARTITPDLFPYPATVHACLDPRRHRSQWGWEHFAGKFWTCQLFTSPIVRVQSRSRTLHKYQHPPSLNSPV